MRRSSALVPLTHDHHHALAAARRVRIAAGENAPQRAEAVAAMLTLYEESLLNHFREEEEQLFPLLVNALPEPPQDLVRALVDHVEIHALMLRLRAGADAGAPAPEVMTEVARRIDDHVHLEERRLFPMIEDVVAASALGGLHLAARAGS